MTTQAIALPQAGGGGGGVVSIVKLLPSNNNNNQQQQHTVATIQQPNQQSVIQATGGATSVQTVQLPKGNVILLKGGQVGQSSVIQSTDSESDVHNGTVQVEILSKNDDGDVIFENDSRKRQEILARRPSYRKIFNDLSSTEAAGAVTTISSEIIKQEDDDNGTATIQVNGQYIKVLPASAIQLGTQDGTIQGIQTLTMTNAGAGGAGTIVQYATQGQDGQFYVPVTVSAADLQTYQIRAPSQTGIAQGVVMTSAGGLQTGQVVVEEASKKRELRLLKNREAAKECRRKKKEYIKCLENRVAVLENQNKALIEELKSLKELYCQKSD
ncbi:cyclic AMP-responsive element-binding protein 1-like isoform X2 [Oppia nitens]|uniref:cyclic AMP-responsive element-binding protein 1-like isoform X2 n=1 Tax=Oppia nitens TaxID=1686743 RepID=UPI0023DA755C|nr:cyclic AMP-responsive element-binding protein 1-like isoform X2 [Oppia nitens]